jgi:5-methylcytosine-specific restriction protein A
MRRSIKTNTLVIISDYTKPYYSDTWENNILHYTGMGQTGNQQLTFMQNKTLNESNTNNVDVHLFEVFEEGKFVYQGKVTLDGKPYQKTQPDYRGKNRTVWIFSLKLVSRKLPAIVPEETFRREEELKEKQTSKLSDEELAKRVASSKRKAPTQKVLSKRYVRNEYVSELAKRNSDGKCQLCGQAAPFNDKNNTPYLEVHHITWLSKGGTDTIENTVALCPNCHRKVHILNLQEDTTYLKNHTTKTKT